MRHSALITLRAAAVVVAVIVPHGVTGCLVTSTVDYSVQEDCPTALAGTGATPAFGSIRRVNALAASPEFSASLSVRSCALARPLQARVYLDGRTPALELLVQPNGEVVRDVTFNLPLAGVALGCHKVEVRVTRRFAFSDFNTPDTAGDLAYAVWWVDVQEDKSSSSAQLTECPSP